MFDEVTLIFNRPSGADGITMFESTETREKTLVTASWKDRYRDKIRTAAQAVAGIKHGQRVFLSSGPAVPQLLSEALVAREDLTDVEIVHIMTLGPAPYIDPKFVGRFRHNAFFIGENVRKAIKEGRADYTPIFLSEIAELFRSRRMVIDAALLQVSPPDAFGYCSFGISCDVGKSAADMAPLIIAQVNEQMPRVLGDNFIHVSDIDVMVPCDMPLFELTMGKPDDLSRRIARHIANLIEDGSTLQLGIGNIPDAVLHNLHGFKNLGIHTEMFSDGVIPLVEAGVIDNSEKTLHRGKIVASFVIGSRKLYDFVNNNPMVEFHPTEYVNDPFVIAQNEKLVSINGAIEVDLTGQVCSDSIGTAFYSGIGGQVDFMRGAARSHEGKPIIALPSTTGDGSVSRIVPTLKPGAGVVTSRGDVHYVVTEHGVAYLHGRNVRERAMALIQIADPRFRPWLVGEAKSRRLIYPDQIELPIRTPVYPEDLERWIVLKDGRRAFLRPLKLTDEPLLRDMFYRLSEESIHYRFFRMIKAMPHERLQEFLKVDYDADMALVMLTDADADGQLMGIAHYSKDPRNTFAEAAFLVRDEDHGKGIGTQMLQSLVEAAISRGVTGFTAEVLLDNQGMLRVFHKCGYPVQSELSDGKYSLRIPFKRRKRTTASRADNL